MAYYQYGVGAKKKGIPDVVQSSEHVIPDDAPPALRTDDADDSVSHKEEYKLELDETQQQVLADFLSDAFKDDTATSEETQPP